MFLLFKSITLMCVLWSITQASYSLKISRILSPNGEFIKPLLVSRQVGSTAHIQVQNFIQNHFTKLGWHFEKDQFQAETVIGTMQFTNLIATANPAANKRIILAAHYDSKRDFVHNRVKVTNFIGATDSAWSCSLLLELAASLPRIDSQDLTIQLIFFDGEESFIDWNESDSIYGAKHLARHWASSTKPYHRLDSIKYFMLLDLMGAANSKFYSHYPNTFSIFRKLAVAETEARQRKLLQTPERIFVTEQVVNGVSGGRYIVEDDHVPFHKVGVPVVHLIPLPFPRVWHTAADDSTALDPAMCHDLALIIYSVIRNDLTAT